MVVTIKQKKKELPVRPKEESLGQYMAIYSPWINEQNIRNMFLKNLLFYIANLETIDKNWLGVETVPSNSNFKHSDISTPAAWSNWD